MKQKQKLGELIDKAPPGRFEKKVKDKLPQIKEGLGKLADLMDGVGRYDETSQKTYLDEESLRKLLREGMKGSEDAVIARLKSMPDNNIRKDTGGMTRIDWETVAQHMGQPGESLPPYSSKGEVRAAVKKKFPNIPDSAFDADELHSKLSGALNTLGAEGLSPGTDCCYRKLGFWGYMTLIAIVIYVDGLKRMFDSYGIWGDAAFWAIWTAHSRRWGSLSHA